LGLDALPEEEAAAKVVPPVDAPAGEDETNRAKGTAINTEQMAPAIKRTSALARGTEVASPGEIIGRIVGGEDGDLSWSSMGLLDQDFFNVTTSASDKIRSALSPAAGHK
jgi:hypothetical protein